LSRNCFSGSVLDPESANDNALSSVNADKRIEHLHGHTGTANYSGSLSVESDMVFRDNHLFGTDSMHRNHVSGLGNVHRLIDTLSRHVALHLDSFGMGAFHGTSYS
jgi:hypothetical protein